MIFLVSLERVNVEHRVFPGETCCLECVLDCVSLGIVRGDYLELSALLDVPSGYEDRGSNFALVRPTEARLELLSVAHVRKAATGWSLNCVSS